MIVPFWDFREWENLRVRINLKGHLIQPPIPMQEIPRDNNDDDK